MRYSEDAWLLDGARMVTARRYQLGKVLFEVHYPGCNCSYCKAMPKFGHVSPKRKAWNSWWTWSIRFLGVSYYFRYHSIFYRKRKR